MSERAGRGRQWGIGLCAAAVVVGGGLGLVGYQRMSGLGDRVGGFPAIAAGEEELVSFDSAGGRTAYFESTCFDCGDDGATTIPGVEITSEDGDPVEVEAYGTDGTAVPRHTGSYLSYSRDGFEGEPEYTFRIPEAGAYRIRVDASEAPDGQLRVGPSVRDDWFSGVAMIVGGVLLGGFLLVAGAIVLVVAAVRGRR